jgi:hypothetical protein
LIILFASLFAGAGLGMLWVGKYMLRGLRFLFSLTFDWMRRFAQGVRRKLRRTDREAPQLGKVFFVKQ